MNQQDTGQEAVLRVERGLLAQALPERPKQLDELAVMGRQFLKVPAFAHLHAQRPRGQYILGGGLEQDGVFLHAKLQQGGIDVAAVKTRRGQYRGCNRTKPLPFELFAHLLALVGRQLGQHRQAP
ncbi:hypothetical protein D3C79_844470 [compost metagenome]